MSKTVNPWKNVTIVKPTLNPLLNNKPVSKKVLKSTKKSQEEATYNKKTYDCFFENNVKATDGETTIQSENLDLFASKDTASIYNNVNLINKNGSIKADKVDYDFETKYYKISMFNDEKVKIKLIQ